MVGQIKYDSNSVSDDGHDYSEATERCPMEGGDEGGRGFSFPACCSIPLQPLMAYVNKTIQFVATEGYHVDININIHVNKMAK
jgi:hypothetical protein